MAGHEMDERRSLEVDDILVESATMMGVERYSLMVRFLDPSGLAMLDGYHSTMESSGLVLSSTVPPIYGMMLLSSALYPDLPGVRTLDG